MAKELYRLTSAERSIFERTPSNPNLFTNWYFSGPNTGTYAAPDATDSRYILLHKALMERWLKVDRPRQFDWTYSFDEVPLMPFTSVSGDVYMRGLTIPTLSCKVSATIRPLQRFPHFQVHHGLWMQDWQLEILRLKQSGRVLVGGYGCIAPETPVIMKAPGAVPSVMSVEKLYKRNIAPWVHAWDADNGRFVWTQASVPWVKGKADLYKVSTEQKDITVTLDHLFLVEGGEWKTLREIIEERPNLSFYWNDTSLCHYPVTSVELVRKNAPFYDIHVPVYENYSAGGFINHNSSKTTIGLVDVMIQAATQPGYQGFALAPYSMQSTSIYKKIMGLMQGTLYGQRFLQRNTRKQPEEISIGNDHVGESMINFYSIMDDSDKILNLEGDMAMIDQTEQLPDIATARGNVVSRLRGNFQGRDRLGIVYYIANPNDNPDLWDLVDDAEIHPEDIYYRQISSYENWALTDKQLRDYELNFGGDEKSRNTKLKGYRPVGDGKIFSATIIEGILSEHLDNAMKDGLELQLPGYVKVELPRIGVHKWELPYNPQQKYMVVADPGQDNPPKRNAAAIGVWNITNFPETPARLTAFHWVFGNGSPEPWMQSFFDYVKTYKAEGMCGYDSTGWQSGYDRWVDIFAKIQSRGLKMDGSTKFLLRNSTSIVMAKKLIQVPTIPMLTSQLAKYDIPDEKLVQDIVAMLMLTCGWMQELFFLNTRMDDLQVPVPEPHERHEWRKNDRRATRFR